MKYLSLLHIVIISFIFLLTPIIHAAEEDKPRLRSSYKNLSMKQAFEIPHLVIHEWGEGSLRCHSRLTHNYHLKTINGDKVVVDYATKLMWHQSGSSKRMWGVEADRWLKVLNKNKYAGYHVWRLPTLEEAASLLESSQKSGFLFGKLYIDPVFDKKQWKIWTGDNSTDRESISIPWSVSFSSGAVQNFNVNPYVRPVISIK
jgi:hypothetical protein